MRWFSASVMAMLLAVLPPGGTLVDNEGIVHKATIEAIAADPTQPLSGTLLPVGESWNPIIEAEPAGTTYVVESGVHYEQADLKDGDFLIGQPGAVMDGRSVTVWAVQPNSANNVTIRGLEIRNYNPEEQYAPITSRTHEGASAGIGWTVENCDVHHSSYAGLALSDGSIPVTTGSMTTASSA